MKQENNLMQLVQSFFQEYLTVHRGLSNNTVMAYRDALKLFFLHESTRQNKHIAKMSLDDVNAEAVLMFLSKIESERNNSIITRNLRLAALRTFCLFLTTKDTLRVGEYQRIIAIPIKRSPHKVIGYLEVNEMQSILKSINCDNAAGQRDYVLLNLLYNTGARVQEICDLKVKSIAFGKMPVVTITGKGNKTRHVPIWPDTAKLLQDYLKANQLYEQPDVNIFMNLQGQSLTRFGVRYIIKQRCHSAESSCPTLKIKKIGPHTFRHTIAMHFLQAGIDLSIIKNWLGHVNLATTNAYVEIDMNMKRKALNSCIPAGEAKSLKNLLDKNKDVLAWLESL